MSFEFKYLIPLKEVDNLREQIKPFTRLTSNAALNPSGEMTVRSIYFDTPAFDHFHYRRDKITLRKDVRMSGQDIDVTKVFLETARQNDDVFSKTKATVPFDRIKQMFNGDIHSSEFLWSINKKEAASKFFFQIHRYHLRPVIKIVHDREPFTSVIPDKENDFKILIQKNFRCSAFPAIDSLFEEGTMKNVLQNQAILTIRYSRSIPAWLKPLLTEIKFSQGRMSKYRICMESLPEINVRSKFGNLVKGRFFNQNMPSSG